jgi:hypothetical protein
LARRAVRQRCRYQFGWGSDARQAAIRPTARCGRRCPNRREPVGYIPSKYPEDQPTKTRQPVMSRAVVDDVVRSASGPSRRATTRPVIVRHVDGPAREGADASSGWLL